MTLAPCVSLGDRGGHSDESHEPFEVDPSQLLPVSHARRSDFAPRPSVAAAPCEGVEGQLSIADWSGWAGRLGGRRGWPLLCESLRLLNELAETFDGLLVGAEVVAVEGLLGAPVLLGLLLKDPRQRRRWRLRWCRRRAAARRRALGGPVQYLVDRVGEVGGVAELVVEEHRHSSQLRDRSLAGLHEDGLHIQQ